MTELVALGQATGPVLLSCPVVAILAPAAATPAKAPSQAFQHKQPPPLADQPQMPLQHQMVFGNVCRPELRMVRIESPDGIIPAAHPVELAGLFPGQGIGKEHLPLPSILFEF
jgi:hypothetical protein